MPQPRKIIEELEFRLEDIVKFDLFTSRHMTDDERASNLRKISL